MTLMELTTTYNTTYNRRGPLESTFRCHVVSRPPNFRGKGVRPRVALDFRVLGASLGSTPLYYLQHLQHYYLTTLIPNKLECCKLVFGKTLKMTLFRGGMGIKSAGSMAGFSRAIPRSISSPTMEVSNYGRT